MKAVGLYRYLPIDDPQSLVELELPQPEPGARDLLVTVRAIAINPIDTKLRAPKPRVETQPRVLGWDAAGEVAAVGPEVRLFQPGDRVYYAGDIARPGCNAELQVVDERIAARMPQSLSIEQAAALPLTSITAWEGLFDRLKVPSPPRAMPRRSLLVIGGAGGVGSMVTQLAARVAGLTVIATASRPESQAWCRQMGADHVVDHYDDLVAQVRDIGFEHVDYVYLAYDTDRNYPAAAELVAPQGAICLIVGNQGPLDMGPLKVKSAALCWEYMFARPQYGTPDLIEQHHLLTEIARLVDQGLIRTTLTEVLGKIDAATLREAHRRIEAGHTTGKLVLAGF